MSKLESYMNQNIFEPAYLFHGSPFEIEELEPRQSIDEQNKENEDRAVFLTSNFITAVAYAFRNKLKEMNENYSFSINNSGQMPAMIFDVNTLPEDLFGYVYVFSKDASIMKDNREYTIQYRCYHPIKPIDVVKVYYKDFAKYFKRENR